MVIVCFIERISNASAGVTAFHYSERRAEIGEDLVSALQLPDLVDDDAVCSLDKEGPLYILLVDSSERAIHVRVPEDECGKYRTDVANALGKLNFEKTRRFRVLVEERLLE